MIIDGHAHACGEFLHADQILSRLDAVGASMVVLSPAEPGSSRTYRVPDLAGRFPGPVWMYPVNKLVKFAVVVKGMARKLNEGNVQVHDLHLAAPDRILQCYWLDTEGPDPLLQLERDHSRWRFSMVKMHQCWTAFDPAGPLVHEVASWCGRRGLPLFAHLYRARDVAAYYQTVRAHPQTNFVLAHCIDVDVMARQRPLDNLFFDISPPDLVSVRQIRTAVRHAGSDHVLLGSDTPYGRDNLRRNIEKIRRIEDLTAADRDRILGQNLFDLLQSPASFSD
ncbi:MAG: hypothetical protein CVU59_11805 [Deltaproteobacteria bacterium HGW-Deltaproteobacteria-17]|nr:MAG: hypothetical protein CVU59_11805 [Deltaproteobacteria bacterium HGW-Deltaproteobacteria-17]